MSKKKQVKAPVADGKEVEFYSVFLNGWITNRMEMDKSLLTLSTAGIGALMLLKDSFKDQFAFHIWVAAGLAFLACIGVLCSARLQMNIKFLNIKCLLNLITESHQLLFNCLAFLFIQLLGDFK